MNCSPKCKGCFGTTPFDCIDCVEHSRKNKFGACECIDAWIGEGCNVKIDID